MANNWIVLTADRAPHVTHEIIGLTLWDAYTAAADEVVYTDPVDADDNRVDGAWKVSGSVTLAAGVYTYTDPGVEPTLIERQRSQIFEAYKYWRVFGRTDHWAGIRHGLVDDMDATRSVKTIPLDSTDKWAYMVVALVDQAIHGLFPISGAYTPEALQDFIDHAENVLRNQGPTWYLAQINSNGQPQQPAENYARESVADGATIYTDIVTTLGVHLTITGIWISMVVPIRAGFNPEMRNLGN